MNINEFSSSLEDAEPPASLTPHAEAIWWGLRGEWDRAHGIVQELPDSTAAWIHACVHREEGDLSNARYWYQHAGRVEASGSTTEELRSIAAEILGD